MKQSRSVLLVASGLLMALLLGGGLVVKVGAAENSYRQAVLFAEILSQVLDNYVDPVQPDALLHGAYEGMLGSLDPNGAYLSPDEVEAWKHNAGSEGGAAGPGISVLKGDRALQVVAVDAGSPAEDAGIEVGDHIRSVGGTLVRDLSLEQARRLIRGEPGTTVQIEVLHPDDGFRREELELARTSRKPAPYELEVERGTAVVRIHDLANFPLDDLAAELSDVRSRPIERLLIDLRNLAAGNPRDAARVATLFTGQAHLDLRDRSGRLLDSVEPAAHQRAWTGSMAVLVNGATADGAEALAVLLAADPQVRIFGQTTFGLGAEPKLYELQNGAGLLLSSALWETASGRSWHEKGVTPDETVEGHGRNFADVSRDQLQRVLGMLEGNADEQIEHRAA